MKLLFPVFAAFVVNLSSAAAQQVPHQKKHLQSGLFIEVSDFTMIAIPKAACVSSFDEMYTKNQLDEGYTFHKVSDRFSIGENSSLVKEAQPFSSESSLAFPFNRIGSYVGRDTLRVRPFKAIVGFRATDGDRVYPTTLTLETSNGNRTFTLLLSQPFFEDFKLL